LDRHRCLLVLGKSVAAMLSQRATIDRRHVKQPKSCINLPKAPAHWSRYPPSVNVVINANWTNTRLDNSIVPCFPERVYIDAIKRQDYAVRGSLLLPRLATVKPSCLNWQIRLSDPSQKKR
jgi:hypothetical protein